MVYNDIEKSKLRFDFQHLSLYFSSDFYLKKFENNYITYLNNETIKLCVKYKCVFVADEMILLSLYQKIEKRGFRAYYNDVRINRNYNISSYIDDKSFNI